MQPRPQRHAKSLSPILRQEPRRQLPVRKSVDDQQAGAKEGGGAIEELNSKRQVMLISLPNACTRGLVLVIWIQASF
jgi:hypothetical protein